MSYSLTVKAKWSKYSQEDVGNYLALHRYVNNLDTPRALGIISKLPP